MTGPITGFLAAMFGDEVTIESYVSQDLYGAATYGAGVVRACHIEGSSRVVRDASGQQRVSMVQVFLDGVYGVAAKDRVTLPAQYVPQVQPIIAVEFMSDESGAHHEIILC